MKKSNLKNKSPKPTALSQSPIQESKSKSKKSTIREIVVNDRNDDSRNKFKTNKVHTTKYTLLNFLPYFLFNEFSRPANIFFAFIILVQQLDDSEKNERGTTIIPLSLVLAFSACKEIFEELKRRTNDFKANNQSIYALKGNKFTEICCQDLRVGEIVKVKKGDRFPADLVLISSSEPLGMAYVETSNVDGESNLKIRSANTRTTHLIDEKSLSALQATIRCEQPNERIYNFEGNMDINFGERFSLDQTNILLRGAVLKNTQWIYGIVVYTGHQTKIMMNSSKTPTKITQMEKKTDQQYFFIAIGLIFLTICGAIGNWYFDTQILPSHWYLNPTKDHYIKKDWNLSVVVKTMLTYLLLLNTLVPISLSVTLEFIRLVMAFLVSQDIELYDQSTDSKAVARSSNLMEELGQIQCILTDKTGTLTRNEMILRHLVIEGEIYFDCKDPNSKLLKAIHDNSVSVSNNSNAKLKENIDFFLKMLATCHTVMIDYSDSDNPCFQGSSPDELAMVNAASEIGYKFIKRSSGSILIRIPSGESVEIEIIAVIEFTSARKRMSIVALMPDNNYYLFCKGADSIIFDRLSKNTAAPAAASSPHKKSLEALEEFAGAGLRTLCFAYRKLDKDFALEWLDKWNSALNTVSDRQSAIDSVAHLIETDLHFIGATGVEDRLQDGVPETIQTLMKANIKIWMLTGDRFETAISTAFLSNLLETFTIQLHLLNSDPQVILKSLENFLIVMSTSPKESKFALVINGPVIEIIFSDQFLKSPDLSNFKRIVKKCRTLLCCRLSPLQKSQITRFVREHLNLVTLAIGDGGNDVSMIQAANVGVGISGKEGLQASRSADFSIAQFKFLVKLILVHGSWSLHRLSRVVLYSIHKNFVLFFTQFWFSYYNSFSAASLYESWMVVNWNLVFTSWPPTIIGLTDQYVFASELVENPQLYEYGQRNNFYDDKTFWRSAANAIFHSFIIFFSVILLFPEGFVTTTGLPSTQLMLGSLIFAIILSVVCMKIALFTNYFTVILGILVIFSAGMWYFFVPLAHHLLPGFLPNASSLELFSLPVFWATLLLVPVLSTSRDFIWKFYRRQFRPHSYHIVQEIKLVHDEKSEIIKDDSSALENLFINGSNANPRKSLGFSFSQSYGQSRVLQAYGQSPKLTSKLSRN